VLLKHWEMLKVNRLFVQAALYIGTPECLSAAATAVAEHHPGGAAFAFVDQYFGFRTSGLRDRLEVRHLEALRAYLAVIDDHTLAEIVEFCAQRRNRSWSITNLAPEVTKRARSLPAGCLELASYIERVRCEHFPADEDLASALETIEQNPHSHQISFAIERWCDGFERRGDPHSRWQEVLRNWLAAKPSLDRLAVVANAVIQSGGRGDLKLLQVPVDAHDCTSRAELIRRQAAYFVKRRTLAL